MKPPGACNSECLCNNLQHKWWHWRGKVAVVTTLPLWLALVGSCHGNYFIITWLHLRLSTDHLCDHCTVHPMNYAYGSHFVVFLLRLGNNWLYPYPSGLLHRHWGNRMIAPVPVKQSWRIWIYRCHESTKTNHMSITKQSKTLPCVNSNLLP